MYILILDVKYSLLESCLQDANGLVKKSKGNHVRSEGFAISDIRGDLFTCPDGTSLAHCISQDIRMGKGIATLFKVRKYERDNLNFSTTVLFVFMI